MKLFLASVLLVAVEAASLGGEQCGGGPADWCRSLQTASSCHAFSYCLRTEWKSRSFCGQPTKECLYHQKLVKTVRHVLNKDKGHGEAIHLIATMCSYIHEDDSRKQCKDLVTDFLPQILKLMESDLEPSSVAAAMGLCKPCNKTQDMEKSIYTPSNSTMCSDCHAFVAHVSRLANTPGMEEQIEKVVEDIVCSDLGALPILCKSIVKVGLPKLLKFVAKNDPEVVCGLSTFCSNTAKEKIKWNNMYDAIKEAMLDDVKDLSESQASTISKKKPLARNDLEGSLPKEEQDVRESAECAACHLAMKEMDLAIASKRFEAEITPVLHELCNVLPSSLQEPCDEFIATNTPELVNLLLRALDPSKVCDELQFCKDTRPASSGINTDETADVEKAGDSELCEICELIISTVDQFLTENKTEAAVQQALDDICQKLPSGITAQCLSFVNEYAAVVVQLLVQEELDPHQLCMEIKLCQSAADETTDAEKIGDSELCEVCELIISTVDQFLTDNKTEAAVRQALDDICQKLPSGITAQCLSFVNEYAAVVVQLLVQEELDPHQLCMEIKLCQSAAGSAGLWTERDETTDAEKAGDSELCEICELIISTVDQFLTDNKTEAAVQQALDDICQKLPSGITAQCLSFVNEYAAVVVQLLVQEELDPHQLCMEIKLCQSAAELASLSKPAEEETTGAGCFLCDLVISGVIDLIGNNQSEAELRHALDNVCTLFPSITSLECQEFVDACTPTIIHLLEQGIKAEDFCKELGFCSDSESMKEAINADLTVPKERAENILCIVCEVLTGMLDEMITANKSEAAIEEALDKVCSLLPSTVASECMSIINVYAPAIINLLVQEIPPHEVCVRIGLCSSSLRVLVTMPKADNVADPVMCELCKVVITEINRLIGENRTEQEIIHEVEKVCDLVQGDLRLQCKSEVENYGPAVLDLLQHMDDPSRVCTDIHLCTSTPSANSSPLTQQMRIGDEECTQGPAFWCANMDNARKCGMEQECEEKYGLIP